MKRNPTEVELGGQKGRYRSHQYRLLASLAGSVATTTTSRRRKLFSWFGDTSANERLSQLSQRKATMLQTPSFVQWTFFFFPITAPPNFPLSSIKEFPFLCFIRLACGLTQLYVPNCNSLLLLNKPILLVK